MKMIKVALTLSFLAGLTAVAAPAHADAAYGTAGCGLGSLVIGNKPGIVQVVAATLNGTGYQTFAITSGTSNCGDTGGGVKSAQAFVETNREALAKDIARGQGETISSLSTLAGCDGKTVGSALQADFGKIFTKSSLTDKEVSANVVGALKSHGELSCKKLI
jgi:hypothetical protein